jgi:hypothetical protein
LIGLVRASLIDFMVAYHVTGDSTNFPVPCNMPHQSADYRPLDASLRLGGRRKRNT